MSTILRAAFTKSKTLGHRSAPPITAGAAPATTTSEIRSHCLRLKADLITDQGNRWLMLAFIFLADSTYNPKGQSDCAPPLLDRSRTATAPMSLRCSLEIGSWLRVTFHDWQRVLINHRAASLACRKTSHPAGIVTRASLSETLKGPNRDGRS